MKTITGFALCAPVAMLVLTGCATVDDPTPVASTHSRECKVVAVHSARDSQYYDVHGTDPGQDSMDQAQGLAGLGKTQQPPVQRNLREPAGIGKVELAMRNC